MTGTKYKSIEIKQEWDSNDINNGVATSRLWNDGGDNNKGGKNNGAATNNDDDNDKSNPHPQDRLTPAYSSTTRQSTLIVGTFNLIATIVGGGVLSLPMVFHSLGILCTTVFMMASAWMTYVSLVMLCLCGRRTGATSYGEVVRSAFGERYEEGVSWLLFVFLVFVIMGYMVLIRDIWTPLVGVFVQIYRHGDAAGVTNDEADYEDDAEGNGEVDGDKVLLAIILLLLPFLVQRSLHALRWNCYIGFASVFLLCVALCRGGWIRYLRRMHHEAMSLQYNTSTRQGYGMEEEKDAYDSRVDQFTIQFFKIPSPQEILFSFPIITCAFLCHFNIIAIQNALAIPSRKRMQNLITFAIAACFTLMYAFGLGGYLYAGEAIQGNVLLNVPMTIGGDNSENFDNGDDDGILSAAEANEYWLFLIGRIGCGTTIMLAMPLMTLPCREAFLEVVDVWFHQYHHTNHILPTNDDANSKQQAWWKDLYERCCRCCCYPPQETPFQVINTTTAQTLLMTRQQSSNITDDEIDDEISEIPRGERVSLLIRHDPIQKDYIFQKPLAHYGSTFLILGMCYCGAVIVRGVAVVWSFIGSSMAFLIAFILPCGCFLRIESEIAIEGGDRYSGWLGIAWGLLVFSIVGAVVCTWNSLTSTSI